MFCEILCSNIMYADYVRAKYWVSGDHYEFENMCMTMNLHQAEWGNDSCSENKTFVCQTGR